MTKLPRLNCPAYILQRGFWQIPNISNQIHLAKIKVFRRHGPSQIRSNECYAQWQAHNAPISLFTWKPAVNSVVQSIKIQTWYLPNASHELFNFTPRKAGRHD